MVGRKPFAWCWPRANCGPFRRGYPIQGLAAAAGRSKSTTAAPNCGRAGGYRRRRPHLAAAAESWPWSGAGLRCGRTVAFTICITAPTSVRDSKLRQLPITLLPPLHIIIATPRKGGFVWKTESKAVVASGLTDRKWVSGGRVPASCPPGFQGRYTVQPGDTMFFIAQRFGVSLQALINANPISPTVLVFPGDVLCVPGGGRQAGSCQLSARLPGPLHRGARGYHVLHRPALWRKPQALINANPITNPNEIFPGDVLCVPGPAAMPRPRQLSAGLHVPLYRAAGDTMFSIAQRFGVSLQALINANPQILTPARSSPATCCACPVNRSAGCLPAVRRASGAATPCSRGTPCSASPSASGSASRL